jgi:hypothetical protein
MSEDSNKNDGSTPNPNNNAQNPEEGKSSEHVNLKVCGQGLSYFKNSLSF